MEGCTVTPERQRPQSSHFSKTPCSRPLGLSSAEGPLGEQDQDQEQLILVKTPPSPPHPTNTQSLGVPSKPPSTMHETRDPKQATSMSSAKETAPSEEDEKAKMVQMLRDLEGSTLLTSPQHGGPPTSNATIQHGSCAFSHSQERSTSKVEPPSQYLRRRGNLTLRARRRPPRPTNVRRKEGERKPKPLTRARHRTTRMRGAASRSGRKGPNAWTSTKRRSPKRSTKRSDTSRRH